ncbi:MAG: hypothetical protein WBA16_00620 [Nonlabens sp.]
MKAFYWMFAMLPLLVSDCDPPAELRSSARGYFSTRVVDAQGSPLAGVPVELFGYQSFGDSRIEILPSRPLLQPEEFSLGTGVTGADGFAQFTALTSTNRGYRVAYGLSNGSVAVVYNDSIRLPGSNSVFLIPEIEVDTVSNTTFSFTDASASVDQLQVLATYQQAICVREWITDEIPESLDCDAIERDFFLKPNSERGSFTLPARVGSTVMLTYENAMGNEVTDTFVINTNTPDYEIEL